MLSFFILCLASVVIAQQPCPCTSPSQWEASVHSSNLKLDADLVGQLSYDSIYQRTRILQHVKVGTTETYYDIITFYDAKLVFIVNMKNGECSRSTFDQPWSDFGIQSDATSLGEAYIGSSTIHDAGLFVTIWSGNQTIPLNETARYIQTWTSENCLPVSNIVFEPSGSINYMWYYNITLGIQDSNVFIPPARCWNDKKFPIQYNLFGPRMN
ncbi:unnamed protein product [Adineta steineri]|uniref:Uncharacterized protein n=2 Tax=Adineta steineri TaxID=433720 RepID=A0A815HIR2_9BILA|nr:unnamed protein product [Adineta steineri]